MNADILRFLRQREEIKKEKERKKKLELAQKLKLQQKQTIKENIIMETNRKEALLAMAVGCNLPSETPAEEIVENFLAAIGEKFEDDDAAQILEAFILLDNPTIEDSELVEALDVVTAGCKKLYELTEEKTLKVPAKDLTDAELVKKELADDDLTEEEIAEAIATKKAEKLALAEDALIEAELAEDLEAYTDALIESFEILIEDNINYSELSESELSDIAELVEAVEEHFEAQDVITEQSDMILEAQEAMLAEGAFTRKLKAGGTLSKNLRKGIIKTKKLASDLKKKIDGRKPMRDASKLLLKDKSIKERGKAAMNELIATRNKLRAKNLKNQVKSRQFKSAKSA